MNAKSLTILALVAVAAIALALWMSSSSEQPEEQDYLVPGLLEVINQVSEIRLAAANGESFSITREGDQWLVAQSNGYPADLKKVRGALLALANAQILEAKTAQQDRYPKLGVEDPTQPGATSLGLSLAAGGLSAELVVGRYEGRSRPGTFVRRAGEQQSYLVSGDLAFERNQIDWLLREVLHVDAAEVESVELLHADGQQLRLSKGGEERTNFEVQAVPEGRELTSAAAGNPIAGALSSLRLDAVYLAEEIDLSALAPITAQFHLFDGRSYQVTAAKRKLEGETDAGEQALIHIQGSFDRQRAQSYAEAKRAAGELASQTQEDSGEADQVGAALPELPDFAQVERDAERINDRLGRWIFAIPDYKYDALNKTMDDLLKPQAQAAPADQESGDQ